jgi:hypothetical protein
MLEYHNKDTTDDKTKLQATAIINDSYKYLMDLTTNGIVVTDAVRFVQTNKEKKGVMSPKEGDNKKTQDADHDDEERDQEKIWRRKAKQMNFRRTPLTTPSRE